VGRIYFLRWERITDDNFYHPVRRRLGKAPKDWAYSSLLFCLVSGFVLQPDLRTGIGTFCKGLIFMVASPCYKFLKKGTLMSKITIDNLAVNNEKFLIDLRNKPEDLKCISGGASVDALASAFKNAIAALAAALQAQAR
jgi:hypothetical protein